MHLMTVGLEDYFQVDAFDKLIDRRQWYRFETRLKSSTTKALELLERNNVKATFFVVAWNAQRFPELIREIADAGHEIATSGFYHRGLKAMSRDEFIFDLRRSRAVLEDAGGQPVRGYRLPSGWLKPEDLWMLDVLAEEGFVYDSSLLPSFRQYSDELWRRFPHQHDSENGSVWEFPPSTARIAGLNLPIPGGNYFRQIPHTLTKHVVSRWHKRNPQHPFVMYFHVWELDKKQPRITGAGALSSMRHYRKLGKLNWVLDDYCEKYSFGPVIDYVRDVDPSCIESADIRRLASMAASPELHANPVAEFGEPVKPVQVSTGESKPISIVIPCYNEARGLAYLANTLEHVEQQLAPEFVPTWIFVDDGSSDETWDVLQRIFGDWKNCTLLQHGTNQGVAAAIHTGIRAAKTEVVCSADCDCTYDPLVLKEMIPQLVEGVDLVTASPYHPEGEVKNVPGWRLVLSRGASFLYRKIVGGGLHTYTSCCRVYRRSAVEAIRLERSNFLGIAELLGKLVLGGSKVVEVPATLSVRIFGQSKMKTLKTIGGHLRLLWQLWRDPSRETEPVSNES